jgi:hypothetical protein
MAKWLAFCLNVGGLPSLSTIYRISTLAQLIEYDPIDELLTDD